MATKARGSDAMSVADYGFPSGLHGWNNFDQVPPDYLISQNEQYAWTTWTIASAGNKGLTFQNLNMNVPAASTINGILVEIWWKADSDTDPYFTDYKVQLMKDGSDVGDNLGGYTIPATLTKWEYGGFSDLWGTTWSFSEVNASGFGVDVCPKGFGTGSSEAIGIDYLVVTVCYAGPYSYKFNGIASGQASKINGLSVSAIARILGV